MSTDKVFEECLKKMFGVVGLKYPNKRFVNNPRWFAMIAWTDKDEESFRKWMKKHLMKRMRWRAKQAEKEIAWFMLMYGWATPRNNGCLTVIGKEKRL